MHQLMRQQPPSRIRFRLILATAKNHIIPRGIRPRINSRGAFCRLRICMYPHLPEILTETAFHKLPRSGIERAAIAGGKYVGNDRRRCLAAGV
ncbi:MAG: hypothetical protein L6Q97_08365 [Thermoanaerobaculia bacterium]|nr:hypothetical protein [Thermoanaerobaculia bacterium]